MDGALMSRLELDLGLSLARKELPMIDTPTEARLLDIEAAGVYLGRTPRAVRDLVRTGKIPCVRCDRRVFLDIRDLDAWIDNNKLIRRERQA